MGKSITKKWFRFSVAAEPVWILLFSLLPAAVGLALVAVALLLRK
jgi:hypothetical protein